MKSFTPEMTSKQKANMRTVFAYQVAQMVCKEASTYQEALSILDEAKRQFDVAITLSEPRLENEPRNSWYEKVALPENVVKSIVPNEERKKYGLSPIPGGDVELISMVPIHPL